MASQYNYTPLPSYADDVKAPLLGSHDPEDGVIINVETVPVPQEHGTCAAGRRRCCSSGSGVDGGAAGGRGFFGRMRARCAARRLEKYGPPCDNAGCLKMAKRRRRIRFVIFGLFALFFVVHLFKGAYMLYTLPKRINCVPITSASTTYDLPSSHKLFLDYSLTTGSTTIAHGSDASSNSTTVQVSFKDLTPTDNLLFCTGTFKRGVGLGVYTKDPHAVLPRVVETVITLPEGDATTVKFGGRKAGKCAGHVVRKVMKWKKGEEEK